MTQESGPLVGTNFTDTQWRAIFGGEPGIVGDVDGTAFNLTLGAGTDDALLGSTTQDSVAVVGGFMHRIPEDATQAVTIPPSTNVTGRTDIIAVRLDQGTYTTAPGPCRLVRIEGVEGSTARPSMDEAPPGVEDFPLWAVTRKGNGTTAEGLNQAAKVDLRRRTGPNLTVPGTESLPTDVPLGTRARRGGVDFAREMVGSAATWVELVPTRSGSIGYASNYGRFDTFHPATITYQVDRGWASVYGALKRTGDSTSAPEGESFAVTEPLPIEVRPMGGSQRLGLVDGNWADLYAVEAVYNASTFRIEIRHRNRERSGAIAIGKDAWWVVLNGLTWRVS